MVPTNNLGPDLASKPVNETLYRGMILLTQTMLVVTWIEKSPRGACQILRGKLVCWSAKKQQSVAMSSAKAEYVMQDQGDDSSFDEWGDYGVVDDNYEGPLVFNDDQFEDELEMGDDAFVLIGKEVTPDSEIFEAMFPLLEERLCMTSNTILI
ncbi:hypothetical protein Tco_0935381 [Tanacetum coccineum]